MGRIQSWTTLAGHKVSVTSLLEAPSELPSESSFVANCFLEVAILLTFAAQPLQTRYKSRLSFTMLGEQAAQTLALQMRQWWRGLSFLFPSALPHPAQSTSFDHS